MKKLLSNIIEAGKRTHKDSLFLSRFFYIAIDDTNNYYIKKQIKNDRFLALLIDIPIQYFSRLMGKDYLGIDSSF